MQFTRTILCLVFSAITCVSVIQADEIVSIEPHFKTYPYPFTHFVSKYDPLTQTYDSVPVQMQVESRYVDAGGNIQFIVKIASNSKFNDTSIRLSLDKPKILGWGAIHISYGQYSVAEMMAFVKEQGVNTQKSGHTVLFLTCPVATTAKPSYFYQMTAAVYKNGRVRRVFRSTSFTVIESVYQEVESNENTCHFTLSE